MYCRMICVGTYASAGLGEVAVRGAANESALALRIEPARGLAIGNDGRHRCALAALLLLLLLLVARRRSADRCAVCRVHADCGRVFRCDDCRARAAVRS